MPELRLKESVQRNQVNLDIGAVSLSRSLEMYNVMKCVVMLPWKGSMFTHQLSKVVVKSIGVVGGLVSVIIISLDFYENLSNSIKLNKKFNCLSSNCSMQ